MNNKTKYKVFCKENSDIPIFCQNWWLDSVCGKDNWDVALVEKDNKIIATMPYYMTKKKMLSMILMPKLTQFLGPYIKYPSGQKYEKKLSFEKDILMSLINKLPNVDFFFQKFHSSKSNWLPFYWSGFSQSTQYTYVLEDTSNKDDMFANFRSNIRTDIKKAKKSVDIDTTLGIETFFEINKMTFDRQGMKMPYTLEFLKKLHKACEEHDSSKMYFAIDKEDNIHAAIYVVWDNSTMYYLMSGGNPKYRNSGATSLLLWEAIQYASEMQLKFDFEGSMIEPIERVFRAFGAKQVQYFKLTKSKNKFVNLLFTIFKG